MFDSGVCTPMTTRPWSLCFSAHARTYGRVRRRLMRSHRRATGRHPSDEPQRDLSVSFPSHPSWYLQGVRLRHTLRQVGYYGRLSCTVLSTSLDRVRIRMYNRMPNAVLHAIPPSKVGTMSSPSFRSDDPRALVLPVIWTFLSRRQPSFMLTRRLIPALKGEHLAQHRREPRVSLPMRYKSFISKEVGCVTALSKSSRRCFLWFPGVPGEGRISPGSRGGSRCAD
jgi:hypothetical protein